MTYSMDSKKLTRFEFFSRTDSALACIGDLLNKRHTPDEVRRKMTGAVVITKYNNKTYRIDDVDFDLTPLCKLKEFCCKVLRGHSKNTC